MVVRAASGISTWSSQETKGRDRTGDKALFSALPMRLARQGGERENRPCLQWLIFLLALQRGISD